MRHSIPVFLCLVLMSAGCRQRSDSSSSILDATSQTAAIANVIPDAGKFTYAGGNCHLTLSDITVENNNLKSIKVIPSDDSNSPNCVLRSGREIHYVNCANGRCEKHIDKTTGKEVSSMPLLVMSKTSVLIELKLVFDSGDIFAYYPYDLNGATATTSAPKPRVVDTKPNENAVPNEGKFTAPQSLCSLTLSEVEQVNGKVSSLLVATSKASGATNCLFNDGLKLRYVDCIKGRCETVVNEATREKLKGAPLVLLSEDVIGIENTIHTSPNDTSKVFTWVDTYELN